jgi:integrase
MNTDDRKRLERWLRKNYAATTAYQTLVDLGSIERFAAGELESLSNSAIYSARRMRKSGLELPEAIMTVAAMSTVAHESRTFEARSFEPDDWRALRKLLERSELLEDQILALALLTGLRAGDVLRIEPAKLDDAIQTDSPLEVLVKGGKVRRMLLAPAALKRTAERLRDALAANALLGRAILADCLIVDSTYGHPYKAAYQRLLRRLKALGEQLELGDERFHTHRLRRTAAVAALRSGVDLTTVAQLLGHASIATTQKYLDEDRQQDVANAMDAFHKGLGG